MNEIKKQDVRIEYAKLPIGQRFDPAIVIENNEGSQSSPVHSQGVMSVYFSVIEPHVVIMIVICSFSALSVQLLLFVKCDKFCSS